jgi:hypothetical protein
MEEYMNVNSHVFPEMETLGNLLIHLVPSRTITALMVPFQAKVRLGVEFLRFSLRYVTTLPESVYSKIDSIVAFVSGTEKNTTNKFYESNMKGDFGENWVDEGPDRYVACTFEEWKMGETNVTERQTETPRNCTCVAAYPKLTITDDFATDAYGPLSNDLRMLYSEEVQAKWCNSLMAERLFLALEELGFSWLTVELPWEQMYLLEISGEVGKLTNELLNNAEHTCDATDLITRSEKSIKTLPGWVAEYHRPLISGVQSDLTQDVSKGLSSLQTCSSELSRDIFCATGLAVKFASKAVVGTFRQLHQVFVNAILHKSPMVEFTDRLCDTQRYVHSVSSAVVNVIPTGLIVAIADGDPGMTDAEKQILTDPIKSAMGTALFSFWMLPIEMYKIMNLVFWSLETVLLQIFSMDISGDGLRALLNSLVDLIYQDIYVAMQIYAESYINCLVGAAELLNMVLSPIGGAGAGAVDVAGAPGDLLMLFAKIARILTAVFGKTVIQISSLIAKLGVQFMTIFTSGNALEFLTDLIVLIEKIWAALIEGILYMALKMFNLDKNLAVMSSLSTALNDLGSWVGAWIELLVCTIVEAVLYGIASVVGALESVIDKAINGFIKTWNDCDVCPGEMSEVVLGWSSEIRAMVPDSCGPSPWWSMSIEDGGLNEPEKCRLGSTQLEWDDDLWKCGSQAGPDTEEYCGSKYWIPDATGKAGTGTCHEDFVGPGFAYTFHDFRYKAYNQLAGLLNFRFAKRYKVCVEEEPKQYGFVNYFSSVEKKKAKQKTSARSCDNIQKCVNTPADGWLDLDGKAPDKSNWVDVTYGNYSNVLLPRSFHIESDQPNHPTDGNLELINIFFGAGCNERACNEDWVSSTAQTYPVAIYEAKNRELEINVNSLFLMDRYCPSAPVLDFDCIGEDAMESCRPATGCFRLIQDNVLVDEVGWEKLLSKEGVLDEDETDTLNLKGKLNVWSRHHNDSDPRVPFMSTCINRCSMFQGDESATPDVQVNIRTEINPILWQSILNGFRNKVNECTWF